MSGDPRATVRVEWPDGRFFEYEFTDVVTAWVPQTFSRSVVEDASVSSMSIAFIAGRQVGYREEGLDGQVQTGFRTVQT